MRLPSWATARTSPPYACSVFAAVCTGGLVAPRPGAWATSARLVPTSVAATLASNFELRIGPPLENDPARTGGTVVCVKVDPPRAPAKGHAAAIGGWTP